jgi:DNA (cytosine-5)-methyltransferase 1
MAKKNNFTFIDLFAGIGGIRIAFEREGCNCVFTSEWDAAAQKTYFANFGSMPAGDITKIEPKTIPDFDILTGGFPCQPFSSIGQRQGFLHKTQGTLFHSIAKIIDAKTPKAFLLENVTGILTHDGGKTVDTILEILDQLNYEVVKVVLDSADFGVPQIRKRIYFVGFNRNLGNVPFKFPTVKKKKVFINQFLENRIEGYSISKHLQDVYLFKKNDGRPEVIDKDSRIQVKTLCSAYHKIQRLTGTFVRDGETGLRLFTANECKAVMGFPKNFKIPVSRTQMYRQFGNSVAIPVVQAIAREMAKALVSATKGS